MLKVFRDNLKYLSWVLWLVIAVFILFVFVDFGATVPGGTTVSDAAAVVGKEKITFTEFERAYRQAEDVYRQAYGDQFSSELARQIGLPRQVMETLVADKVLLAEARRMGLRVSDSEVRRQILDYPVFRNEDGSFVGQETYQRILRSNNLTPESFEASVRQDLLTGKVRRVLVHNLFVPEDEVEAAYREQVERARVRLVKLPSERFAEQVDLEPDRLAAWFEAHQEEFRVPERRAVDYLLIDRAAIQATLEVEDAEIDQFYRENLDEFTREEEIRARHILLRTGEERSADDADRELTAIKKRIEAGEDFEEIAREASEDPGSGARGGDLGFFGRGQMVKPFEDAAFSAQLGDLVGPVRSAFGSHLIEVLERRQGGVQTLDEVSGLIRGRLLSERARTVAENKAQELAARIEREGLEGGEAFRTLAEGETGVTFHATEPFGREDNVPGIGRATGFSVAAFDLEPEAVSGPVKTGSGWAILHLREVVEPRVPALDEVREEVEAAYRGERQLDLAVEKLTEQRERLAAGATLEQVAAELGVEVEESEEFGAGGNIGSLGRNGAVARAALELGEGEVGGPVPYDGGAVLFQVVERKAFDPVEFSERRQELREELEERRAGELLAALINARRGELGVRYDPAFAENFQL